MSRNPLGQSAEFPQEYAPEVLFGVPRREARDTFLSGQELPFRGMDIWNAWELTWLDEDGKPEVGTGTILVPSNSENIIESKSLKLYLNSFANTRQESPASLAATITADLGKVARAAIDVTVTPLAASATHNIDLMPGTCIDHLHADCSASDVDPRLLACGSEHRSESLHSHLLRSLCPVTGQPDQGSILVRYSGPEIIHASLLQYLVSFRQHNDFHEACVERIFVDLAARCQPQTLTVYARYNRRGGIDINPFRSNYEDTADNLRLWRQ